MVAMEGVHNASDQRLRQLSKQEHLLLKELKTTKRRLRQEIRARQQRTAPQHEDDSDANSTTPSLSNPPKYGLTAPKPIGCEGPVRERRGLTKSGRAHNNLKRSRSEAGMGAGNFGDCDVVATVTGREAAGEKLEQGKRNNNQQPIATTRIDMLPVMSSTGEGALEVGLSAIPTANDWTVMSHGREASPVHMLPVFRLPVVSKAPANGFIRRIPREETQRERDCRIREEEEMEKMKTALGLTDKELAALEEELLPKKTKRDQTAGNGSSVAGEVTPTLLTGSPVFGHEHEDVQLEENFYERRSDAHSLSIRPNSAFSASEARAALAEKQPSNTRGRERLCLLADSSTHHNNVNRTNRNRDNRSRDRYDGRSSGYADLRQHARDKNGRQDCNDKQSFLVDRPTPRILRRGYVSTFKWEGDTWTGDPAGRIGTTGRLILGTTATTEHLEAATADAGMVNILELRRELGRSVGHVRILAQAVKTHVQEVTQICPVQHPRAVQFLRRWACERLATLSQEILLSRGAAAFERWREAAAQIVLAERRHAYRQYQGSRKMGFTLDKAYLRRLANGWIRWVALVEAGRAEDRHVLEMSAAVTVQTAFRGLAARRQRARLAVAASDKQRHQAAVAITRCVKGKVARVRYARLKANVERVRASEMLRRIGRGMLGRWRARRLREERAKLQVAMGLQRLFRGRKGRRFFLVCRQARMERIAATKLQAITRGKWGRARATGMQRAVEEALAVGKIHRAARAWLARRFVKRLRETEGVRRAIRAAATLVIQRVYRGHRTRILHGARFEIQRSLLREADAAATKIQALVRARLSKRVVAKMARKRREGRTDDARAWVETWSEDAQAWFYYNPSTGEALWQPPETGYTKHDGKLVLTTGEVIQDPLSGLTEQERSQAKKESSCAECELKRATRTCDECGDRYCTACFKKMHASGRRMKHTWKHVGPMECAECESEVAIKWCTACDDPFCGPCWANIHSRGMRSKHNYCTISPAGRVSAKATAPDGTDAGPYTPGDSLKAETAGVQGGGGETALVDVASPVPDWQEYNDDNGIPYWYSANTGASQYENPYAQQIGGSITTTSSYDNGGAWGGGQQWDAVQQGTSTYGDTYGAGTMVFAPEGSSGEWSEHIDDGGRTYYYSSVTGASQYESPY